MKNLVVKPSFEKDLKTLRKKHRPEDELWAVVDLLVSADYIPAKYHDHALSGDMQGFRDIHVTADWIIIYQTTDTEVVLFKTGSHDDVFA